VPQAAFLGALLTFNRCHIIYRHRWLGQCLLFACNFLGSTDAKDSDDDAERDHADTCSVS